MDTLGRKPTTLLMVLFLLLSNALLYVGSSATMLYCARVIGGFTFGMSVSVLPVYVAEISDVSSLHLYLKVSSKSFSRVLDEVQVCRRCDQNFG